MRTLMNKAAATSRLVAPRADQGGDASLRRRSAHRWRSGRRCWPARRRPGPPGSACRVRTNTARAASYSRRASLRWPRRAAADVGEQHAGPRLFERHRQPAMVFQADSSDSSAAGMSPAAAASCPRHRAGQCGRPRQIVGAGAHVELVGQPLRLVDASQRDQRRDRVRVRPQDRRFPDADLLDRDGQRARAGVRRPSRASPAMSSVTPRLRRCSAIAAAKPSDSSAARSASPSARASSSRPR